MIDLKEIQSDDVEEVMKYKIRDAYELVQAPVFAEDSGLFFDNMNGFPGALIKFYLDKIGIDGISKYHGGTQVTAKTIIGYHDGVGIHYFVGELLGTIAEIPRGSGFGWDPIFIPKYNSLGAPNDKTLGELSRSEKNEISMRAIAFGKFKDYLATNFK